MPARRKKLRVLGTALILLLALSGRLMFAMSPSVR